MGKASPRRGTRANPAKDSAPAAPPPKQARGKASQKPAVKAAPVSPASDKEDHPSSNNAPPAASSEAPPAATAGSSKPAARSAASDDATDAQQSMHDTELDAFWVDEKVLKEEESARKSREKAVKAKQAPVLTQEKLLKLDQLLDQAQMYTKFLVEQVSSVQEQFEEPIAEEGEVGGKRKRNVSGKAAAKRAKSGKSPTKALVPLIEGELRAYQLRGVAWLISLWTNGMNGILADQMGLGKTVQTVAFLSHLRDNGINGPFIIIVPLSTLMNWHNEVQRWCPSMASIVYHGSKEERGDIERKWFRPEYNTATPDDFPVIVTSFEIAIRDRKALQKLHYKYLVVDEGHRLKNSNCRLVRELKELHADNKLLLTGTPLQNNLAELWSLLNFLLPAVFNNLEDFESWFDFSGMVSSNDSDSENKSKEILESEAKNRMVSKLHEILKPFLLRRIKADVEASLPAKQEVVLYAPLTPHQRAIQNKLIDRTLVDEMQAKLQANSTTGVNLGKLHNMLMQLRKNCNHPDLITADVEQSMTFPAAADLVAQCGKMQLLEQLLNRLKPQGHKVLIFSQFTKMLDLLDSYLEERGHSARRIDGSIGYLDRMRYMDEFNGDPECFIFLLSTRAGGLGINLTSADTVIIYDSDWNPHQDMQAMDRAHRIGQTKPVLVLRLCTSDSVELKLLRRANSKLALERLVIKKGAFGGEPTADGDAAAGKLSMSAADLLDMLQGNLRLEGEAQNSMITEDMMERLLDRTHLAAKQPAPYPHSGPGYELVAQQTSGLLSSVQ